MSVFERQFMCCTRCFLIFLLLQMLVPNISKATESDSLETNYKVAIEEGVAAFEKGAFEEAKAIFNRIFRMAPSDPVINFYLGRSAFETGDFEGAVFAFERILFIEPDRERVRLEMARAYMEMGSLEEASRLFRMVLETQPPQGVRATILACLARIEQMRKAHFFSGTISIGLNHDSNVYVAPTEGLVTIPALDDLPVRVGDPESDTIIPLILLGSHSYKPPDRSFYWASSIQSYHTRHEDHDDLDVEYVGMSTGIGRRAGNWDIGLFPKGYVMTLGEKRYSEAWGGSLSCSVSLGKGRQLGASAQVMQKRFFQAQGRDGSSITLEGQGRFILGKVGITPFLSYKNESADLDAYSYDRFGTGINFSIPFPVKTNLLAGYLFEHDEYDGHNLLFRTSRQDETHVVDIGISKAFRMGKQFRCVVHITQSWELSSSNIPLYDYDRNVTRLALNLIF